MRMRLSKAWPFILDHCSRSRRFHLLAFPKPYNLTGASDAGLSNILNAKTIYTSGIFHVSATTSVINSSASLNSSKMNTSLLNFMKRYEDIIGLTEVKQAQQLVLQAERDFTKTQELRREKQDEIRDVQTRLKEIHVELDKTSRGEDRYLNLLTQEHAIIKKEKLLLEEFNRLEHSERNCFNILSARLRDSHEKERERGERTKYWSIIGSIIGAILGILGTTISNRLRIYDFKKVVQESSDPGKFQALIAQLTAMIQAQQKQIAIFVTDLNNILGNRESHSSSVVALSSEINRLTVPLVQADAILAALKEQDEKLGQEMQEVKQLIAAEHVHNTNNEGAIVYVGPKMEELLDQTEKNLEWKIKINTLVNVVVLYGALAITIPILYAIFRGG